MPKTKLDKKQMTLILTWHQQAEDSSNEYLKFMNNWIAFNAICYALYHKEAIKERVDPQNNKKLIKISERLLQDSEIKAIEANIKSENEKWTIDVTLTNDLNLKLNVTKKYTEDNIYTSFDREWSDFFNGHMGFIQFSEDLKKSIERGDYNYVVNMAKSDRFIVSEITQMAKDGIVVLMKSIELSEVRKVLYQIRNNIFHGEKTPGEPNDDRIVKAANPVLNLIVSTCIENLENKT
jgi:hypothetical protein